MDTLYTFEIVNEFGDMEVIFEREDYEEVKDHE